MPKDEQAPCKNRVMYVSSREGLCCPPRNQNIWNAHPRVYLAMNNEDTEVQCYYCGTKYLIKE